MKLWRLSEPFDYHFARASRSGGTWQEGEYKQRRRPLVIEWEPDSDVVGDFTWPGLDTDIVVTDRVGQALADAHVEGYELRSVQMQENSEPAKRRSKKAMIKLPYSGPNLWDLWVTAWTRLDRDRSTVSEEHREDGTVAYNVSGVQHEETSWDQQRMELVKRMQPRIPGEGVFVPPIRGIFRVEETPAWIYCTDDVKQLIEDRDFTNVSFLEMGDVLDEPLDGLPPLVP